MKRFFVSLLLCGYAATALAQSGSEGVQVSQPKAKRIAFDEVQIEQEKGRVSNTVKSPVPVTNAARTAPEGTAAAVPSGSTSPNTCDPKNATSPACYTATQQGHGK